MAMHGQQDFYQNVMKPFEARITQDRLACDGQSAQTKAWARQRADALIQEHRTNTGRHEAISQAQLEARAHATVSREFTDHVRVTVTAAHAEVNRVRAEFAQFSTMARRRHMPEVRLGELEQLSSNRDSVLASKRTEREVKLLRLQLRAQTLSLSQMFADYKKAHDADDHVAAAFLEDTLEEALGKGMPAMLANDASQHAREEYRTVRSELDDIQAARLSEDDLGNLAAWQQWIDQAEKDFKAFAPRLIALEQTGGSLAVTLDPGAAA